ncbi:response regulator [Bradyrhizobium sp. WYCCWR 13022]|uniref:response regulator transcription factor n=1 Tax=unclassified Bradyrhizobium TaxID=2631580 RepID=UPI00263AF307|nr:response regulator [Bradyrhizobium sp. WYCCWR 13022]MDN4985591.1 response regulator [Bradyrhizobium sp. WYCCWR 13022]
MKVPFVGVVDDDEALCLSLVDLMRSVGFRSEPFDRAEALLSYTALSSFDCIIADVHMPGMGGLNLVRELQRRKIGSPVILITGLPDKQLDEEARSIGAFCLIRKPFETSVLLECLDKSFRR